MFGYFIFSFSFSGYKLLPRYNSKMKKKVFSSNVIIEPSYINISFSHSSIFIFLLVSPLFHNFLCSKSIKRMVERYIKNKNYLELIIRNGFDKNFSLMKTFLIHYFIRLFVFIFTSIIYNCSDRNRCKRVIEFFN